MDKKKVDICICIKNRENLVDDIVDMFMVQSFKDFNLFLCDDFSGDSTLNKILDAQEKYPGIVYAWQTENEGYIGTHNFILSKTISEYVCVMDSDDIIDSKKIEEEVKFLDSHKDIDIVSSSVAFPNKKVLPNTFVELSHSEIESYLKDGGSMTTVCFFQSTMFRRNVLDEFKNNVYFYDEYVGGRAGEGFLYTLFYLGKKFANITSTIYVYTYKILSDSLSNTMIPVFADNIDKLTNRVKKNRILKLFKKYNLPNQ